MSRVLMLITSAVSSTKLKVLFVETQRWSVEKRRSSSPLERLPELMLRYQFYQFSV